MSSEERKYYLMPLVRENEIEIVSSQLAKYGSLRFANEWTGDDDKDSVFFTKAWKLASVNGFTEIEQLLREHGAKPDGLTEETQSGFIQAVKNNDIDTVRSVLKQNASLANAVEWWGDYDEDHKRRFTAALTKAACKGYTEITQLLLEHGAEVDGLTVPESYQDTPLHDAVECDYKEVVRLLLDYGADMDREDADEDLPWELAIEGSEVEAMLMEAGGRPPDRPSILDEDGWADDAIEALAKGDTVNITLDCDEIAGKLTAGDQITVEPCDYKSLHVGDIVLARCSYDCVRIITEIEREIFRLSANDEQSTYMIGPLNIFGKVVATSKAA